MESGRYFRPWLSVDLTRLSQTLMAGCLAGIAAAAVSRLSMRGVALVAGLEPGFSLGGTVGLLLIGAVGGLLFALPYRLWCRLPWLPAPARGLAYGLALGLTLTAPPFFLAPVGELGLIEPWLGLSLFAPVPLVYGAALGRLTTTFEGQIEADRRAVHLGWPLFFGLLALLLVVNAGPLMSESLPFPPAAWSLYHTWGLTDAQAHGLHSALVLVWLLSYVSLAWIAFWRAGRRRARLAVGGALLFGAAFFHTGVLFPGMMRAFPLLRWLPGLLQAAGWCALILIMVGLASDEEPPGRFRWAGFYVMINAIWSLAWLATPLRGGYLDPASWPESWLATVAWSLLAAGLLGVWWRQRHRPAAERWRRRPAVITISLLILALGLFWSLLLVRPEWGARVSPRLHFQALFAFGPYLLPWLLLPGGLAWAVTRRGLWADGAGPGAGQHWSIETATATLHSGPVVKRPDVPGTSPVGQATIRGVEPFADRTD